METKWAGLEYEEEERDVSEEPWERLCPVLCAIFSPLISSFRALVIKSPVGMSSELAELLTNLLAFHLPSHIW